jgi:hypothetical protein
MTGRLRLILTALAALIGAGVLAGAKVDKNPQTAAAADDPYLWLEDVHGAKALEWVKAQNVKSTAVLQADPDYQKDYDAILRVLDATDRIPYHRCRLRERITHVGCPPRCRPAGRR